MATEYIDPNTVHNPSTGAVIPSAWGDVVRDDLEALIDPPACAAFAAAAQSVPNNTDTVLNAGSEDYDNDGMHSTAVNTSRITVQKAGRYRFEARIQFAAGAGNRRLTTFRINGASSVNGDQRSGVGGGFSTFISTFMTRVCIAGDYVEMRVLQDTGGALDVTLLQFAAKRETR